MTVEPPQKTRHGFSASVAVSALALVLTTFRFSVETRRLSSMSLSRSRPSGRVEVGQHAVAILQELVGVVDQRRQGGIELLAEAVEAFHHRLQLG